MASRSSKRLVIDASVARASGGDEASFPTSKHCRDVLLATLKVCHRLVMTPPIREEWDEHQSRFAQKWRSSMVARRKVVWGEEAPRADLREQVIAATPEERDQEEFVKDFHLVEAALAADSIIVSLDEAVRSLLAAASRSVGELRPLLWANPAIEAGEVVTWLEKGAPMEKARRLGHFRGPSPT